MAVSGAIEGPWDAVVIGTGMGGGLAGRRLAEAGMRVLFIEKGPEGYRREETSLADDIHEAHARLLRGFWPDPVRLRLDGRESSAFLPVGAGVGGTSVFYAATLERPEPHDLDHSADTPHPSGGWPISFAGMLPWFDAAQDLLELTGTPDPLSEHPCPALRRPPPLPPDEEAIMRRMAAGGLHPYRLHSGVGGQAGCLGCVGRKCPRSCKKDGRSAGVEPALATGRATLLAGAEAVRLIMGPDRASGVEVRQHGITRVIPAERVILAGGALFSPRLLLASAGADWPDGVANRSGMVGRNLMFHLNELFAYFPGRAAAADDAPAKAIGFRDLYVAQGQRLGMVQALGLNAGHDNILHALRLQLDRHALTRGRIWREAARLPAGIAARVLGRAKIFVGLIEDLPLPDNRVMPDPDRPGRIMIDYRIPAELLARRRLFRRLLRRALPGQRILFLNAAPEPNLGHACGTLRMGHDPSTSVVDAGCRAHGIGNLWVTDASVFPSSMGVNPSLTIAANALRVADGILEARHG
ncbi:MAG: GMC family oxidoreductase [Rubellimicrobium sp.]|nr:GMC family oxidoreductase [Rubellimicrobium sp.]